MRLNVGRNMERAGDRWCLKYEAGPTWTLLTHNSHVIPRFGTDASYSFFKLMTPETHCIACS